MDLLQTKKKLQFTAGKPFKIMTLADIHGGANYSTQLPAALNAVLDAVKPDLVLLGGDTAGLHQVKVVNEQELRVLLDMLNDAMESRSIPWAHVFGNHDDNFGYTREEQEKVYESYPLCLSKRGPEDIAGVGNYVLPVWSADGKRIAYAVWGLDSLDNENSLKKEMNLPADMAIRLLHPFGHGHGYAGPCPNQVFWYYETSKELEKRNGAKVPGFLYMHEAIPEMNLIFENRKECNFEGFAREDVGCGELNTGLFAAALQRGDVKTMAFGHDHISDFIGTYCGMLLTYMGSITYDGYQDDDLRGARVYEINEADGAVSTYMVRVHDLLGDSANNEAHPRGTYSL